MLLVADAIAVISGCRNNKVQRLPPCRSRTPYHRIVQFAIWLAEQFIKDTAVDVQPIFG
jgi:hypothetical protein